MKSGGLTAAMIIIYVLITDISHGFSVPNIFELTCSLALALMLCCTQSNIKTGGSGGICIDPIP